MTSWLHQNDFGVFLLGFFSSRCIPTGGGDDDDDDDDDDDNNNSILDYFSTLEEESVPRIYKIENHQWNENYVRIILMQTKCLVKLKIKPNHELPIITTTTTTKSQHGGTQNDTEYRVPCTYPEQTKHVPRTHPNTQIPLYSLT